MFMVVILMAIAGAIAARFEAAGMARAMFVAAGAETMIAVVVVANRLGATEPPGFPGVPILVLGFAAHVAGLSASSSSRLLKTDRPMKKAGPFEPRLHRSL